MSFEETRISDVVAYNFRVVPAYKTRIREFDSGKEQRNISRTRAKRRFGPRYNKFKPDAFALLLACFHAVAGSAIGFRFKDWSDYQVTLGSIGNTPGANTTPVQLVKLYAFGSLSRSRTITKPVAGTVTVYQDDGAGNFVAKAGSIDTATGLFTPTTAWTAGRALKATFEFDVPVRFESDEFPADYEDFQAISVDVTLIEDFNA